MAIVAANRDIHNIPSIYFHRKITNPRNANFLSIHSFPIGTGEPCGSHIFFSCAQRHSQ